MRILHLATFLQGGAGAAVRELAIRQRETGYAVAVVTTKTGVAPYGNNPEHLQALAAAGVDVSTVDSLFRRDYAANLNVVRFIQTRLGSPAFDIMHAHSAVASVAAILSASGTRARVLQTMHRWGVRKSAAHIQLDVAVLRQLPRVVVTDRRSRAMLVALGLRADRLGMIAHGVRPYADPFADLDETDPDLRYLRELRRNGRPVLCSIGTVGPNENQRLLVDALTLLPADQRPFCMVIGRGEVGRLTLYARTRGVEQAIRFCGYKPNARRFLKEADGFVLPSADEEPSLSLIEAFCDRVPVIAAANGLVREITQDGAAGRLFAANDASSLASAVRANLGMSADARNAMRHAAHQVYRAEFTAAAMNEQYEAEYQQLLSGSHAREDKEVAA